LFREARIDQFVHRDGAPLDCARRDHAMGAEMRRTAGTLEREARELFAALAAEPWRYDFYQAVRRIEALHPHKPPLGRALRPADEPIRFSQEPSLAFAPSSLSRFEPPDADRPHGRMEVRFLGLLGP